MKTVVYSLFVIFTICSTNLFSQNSSAIIEFESDNQGILIPRMTTNQWISIVNPAEGLLVYDNNLHAFYYYNGTNWQTINTGPIGIGISTIAAVDNMNGTFDIKFTMTDMSERTITTPNLRGPAGPQGDQGPIGMTGAQGPQGDQGPIGMTGAQGPQGDQGMDGATGATGATGPQGDPGMDGATGAIGATGPQGDQGPQGDAGPAGPTQTISLKSDTLVLSDGGGQVKLAMDSLLNLTTPLVINNDTLMIDTTDVLPGQLLSFDGTHWVAANAVVGFHTHTATASLSGGNQSFNIRQPWQAINYIIAIQGLFPSRSSEPLLAQIVLFGGNFAPRGWAFCDGQLLAISSNTALFSLLGTNYGGDGRTTFGLPDLRGRTPIGPRSGPGLSTFREGQRGGSEFSTLNVPQMPSHNHNIQINQN